MKKTNKKPVIIVLNVIAVLFGIYAIITMYSSYTYISELVTQGLVIKDEILNVVSYYVTNSAPYIFYALATWAMGYIIGKVNTISESLIVINNNETEEEKFEEVEELIAAEVIDEEIKEDDIEL